MHWINNFWLNGSDFLELTESKNQTCKKSDLQKSSILLSLSFNDNNIVRVISDQVYFHANAFCSSSFYCFPLS